MTQVPSLRLSWPRVNDRRRSVVAASPSLPSRRNAVAQNADVHIVSVSHEDLEMCYKHAVAEPNEKLYPCLLLVARCEYDPESVHPKLNVPTLCNPFQLRDEDNEMFQYCASGCLVSNFTLLTSVVQCFAVRSLTIFGHSASDLGEALIRMAMGGETASTMAVQQSILAFSSIYRYNVHPRAVEHKISALKALVNASTSHIGTREATQHVAAGMLLLSLEVKISPHLRTVRY